MAGPLTANAGITLTVAAALGLTIAMADIFNDSILKIACLFILNLFLSGSFATYIRWMWMNPPQRTPSLAEVAAAVDAGNPIAPLDPRMLLSAQQMSKDLRNGLYTSAELVELFINHIEKVDAPSVNAVVWKRYKKARKEAQKADLILAEAREGKRSWDEIGWLTGVPCTMKESFRVTGCSNCCGHPRRAATDSKKMKEYAPLIRAHNHPPAICDEDAVNVERLRAEGAIIIALTNTSELAMWIESNNLVYGSTCNPYDAGRIVGGSSGGEAAAVAAIYSPFGNGSDIGGSIRIPSMFCGTFGHKPSTRLVPNNGMFPGTKTYGNFIVGTGTMTRHVEDLWPVMKTLTKGGFDEDPVDYPHCPSLDEQLAKHREYQVELDKNQQHQQGSALAEKINCPADIPASSLTIYFIEDLKVYGSLACSNEQRRAARVAVETLAKNSGCALKKVDFNDPATVPEGWEQMRFALKMWAAVMRRDAVAFVDLMRGGYSKKEEYGSVYIEWLRWLCGKSEHTFPATTLCVLEDLEKRFVPEKDTDCDVAAAKLLAKQISDTLGLRGVLVCPAFPYVAAKHHQAKLLVPSFTYTCLFNALQVPTTSVPIWLSEDSNAQKLPCGVQVISGWGNDVITMAAAAALAKYTPYCYVKVPQWMTVMDDNKEMAKEAPESLINH